MQNDASTNLPVSRGASSPSSDSSSVACHQCGTWSWAQLLPLSGSQNRAIRMDDVNSSSYSIPLPGVLCSHEKRGLWETEQLFVGRLDDFSREGQLAELWLHLLPLSLCCHYHWAHLASESVGRGARSLHSVLWRKESSPGSEFPKVLHNPGFTSEYFQNYP